MKLKTQTEVIILLVVITYCQIDQLYCENQSNDSIPQAHIDEYSPTCTEYTRNIQERCNCSYEVFSCLNAGLTSLPNLVSKKYGRFSSIILDGNNITKLAPGMFQSSSWLSVLNLARSQIRDIEKDTFIDFGIEYMYLNGNKLSKLTPGMFDGLREVSEIHLQDNEITTIEKNTFRNLNILSRLDLSGNRITRLVAGTFLGLRSVVEMVLENNKIDTIEGNLFDPEMYTLAVLNLGHNELSELNARMFQSYQGCFPYSLYLNDNKITNIGKYALTTLRCATIIDLSRNRITKLYADIFGGEGDQKTYKYWLQDLLLSENNISQIEPATFRRPTNLKYVNLSGNPIHDGDPILFGLNPKTTNLSVDDISVCCNTLFEKSCEWKGNGTCEDLREEHAISKPLIWFVIIIVIVAILMYVTRRKFSAN